MILKRIFSGENLFKAWKKSRKGYKNSGIDCITKKDFEENLKDNLKIIQREIIWESYIPSPHMGFEKIKENKTKRELSIICFRDHIAQQAVHMYLNSVFESIFYENSFAFRPERSVDRAIEKLLAISQKGYNTVLKADISTFFDSIDRNILYRILYKYIQDKPLIRLIKKWVEVGVIRNRKLIKKDYGIPQGSVISPILSNIYLHPFDMLINGKGFKLIRYCDDFVILTEHQEKAYQALTEVRMVLSKLKLNIKKESLLITNMKHGFKFLGKEVNNDVKSISERTGNSFTKEKRPSYSYQKK